MQRLASPRLVLREGGERGSCQTRGVGSKRPVSGGGVGGGGGRGVARRGGRRAAVAIEGAPQRYSVANGG